MNNGRTGYTTGACAAAAAKAAMLYLLGRETCERVVIPFPDGERRSLPVKWVLLRGNGIEAAVVKDAGDDPDVTDGAVVSALVEWIPSGDIVFAAGIGVGTVMKRGLSLPPGEPAINPGPRNMIRAALSEVTDRPVRVTVSISGGQELARKTYNPRLGIVNGLSVLGTSGIVRPFSIEACRCSLALALSVARAHGVTEPVLVPGRIGERSARKFFALVPERIIEVGNEWGFVLGNLGRYGMRRVLLWGHAGKLVKLIAGHEDTHSSRSGSPVEIVARFAGSLLHREMPEVSTTEGIFGALDPAEQKKLADSLASAVAQASDAMAGGGMEVSVVLVNMAGVIVGTHGGLEPWL
jgi:cobalt-precorrin-5B (C1)-methyltransferase